MPPDRAEKAAKVDIDILLASVNARHIPTPNRRFPRTVNKYGNPSVNHPELYKQENILLRDLVRDIAGIFTSH
jgi:hypothetical protein